MKTKTLITCLLVAVASLKTSFAQDIKSSANTIQGFIESHINSDAKKLNSILSDDATYKIPRQSTITVQTKSALIAAMKKEAGVKQNCSSTSKVLAATDALVIARVDFIYPEFTQQNYLTLEKDADKAWKISAVYKIFVDDSAAGSGPVSTVN